MTADQPITPRNGDASRGAPLLPAQAGPESMLELRQEASELARTLPGALRRLRVRGGDREIEVEWAEQVAAPESTTDRQAASHAATTGLHAEAASPPTVDETLTAVRAPLVGCFYTAPSPGAEPFVQVGDEVEAGTTVAIIEAMKLMNTIVAGESGVVAEVLVSNGESVEYDQVLLRLRPKEQAA